MVGGQRLPIVRRTVAAHRMKLPPAEVSLDLGEDAEKVRVNRSPVPVPVAEEPRKREPFTTSRPAVLTIWLILDAVTAVEVFEPQRPMIAHARRRSLGVGLPCRDDKKADEKEKAPRLCIATAGS